ncbi:MAG: hypothetical protein CR968_06275 [Flavobacteriia bacterium]|nr:MAG: hypothetical protein CR968_06275 [Flavobacteriia bacterium]
MVQFFKNSHKKHNHQKLSDVKIFNQIAFRGQIQTLIDPLMALKAGFVETLKPNLSGKKTKQKPTGFYESGGSDLYL